jgi:hypothetical protein
MTQTNMIIITKIKKIKQLSTVSGELHFTDEGRG